MYAFAGWMVVSRLFVCLPFSLPLCLSVFRLIVLCYCTVIVVCRFVVGNLSSMWSLVVVIAVQ